MDPSTDEAHGEPVKDILEDSKAAAGQVSISPLTHNAPLRPSDRTFFLRDRVPHGQVVCVQRLQRLCTMLARTRTHASIFTTCCRF